MNFVNKTKLFVKWLVWTYDMEASEEEWVNSENYWGDWIIALRMTIALVILGVNLLFLGGLHAYELRKLLYYPKIKNKDNSPMNR